MGLDQYFYVVPKDFPVGELGEEDYYYRKHADLQGKIEEIWRRETKSTEDFNCVNFELTPEILDELVEYGKSKCEEAKENGYKPGYGGFFWGEGRVEEWHRFFAEAAEMKRAITEHGQKVIYSSWW